jgi:hypothetical protein
MIKIIGILLALLVSGCAEPMTKKRLIETIKPDGCSVSFVRLGRGSMELSGYELGIHWDF